MAQRQRDTLLILTLDDNAVRWNEAATEIYGLLQSVTKRDIEIKFELRNEGLMYKDNVSDLHSREINDPLEVIQPNSVKKFESLIPTRRDVGFLASVTQSSFDNPNRKPPLFIEVDPGTRMRWEMVEDETCGDG